MTKPEELKMPKQKVEKKTPDALDDVNVDKETLEFLMENVDDSASGSSSDKRLHGLSSDGIEGRDMIVEHSDVNIAVTTHCESERLLKLRKFLHRQSLLSERAGVVNMKQLLMCKNLFERDLSSNDPLLTQAEINILFYKVDEIKAVIEELCNRLEEIFGNWSINIRMLPAYQYAIDQIPLLTDYEENLPEALRIVDSNGGTEVFDEIISGELPLIEKNFDDLITEPVKMQKRVACCIREILKYTPTDHSDYDEMKTALNNMAFLLDNFWFTPQEPGENFAFYILKSGYMVQMIKNVRKLRYLFLFPSCLIITKLKMPYGFLKYTIKDIILFESLTWQVSESTESQLTEASNAAKKNLTDAKNDLEKLLGISDSNQTLNKWRINRLKKRIYQNEKSEMLFTANIKLTLDDSDKSYTFFSLSRANVDDWIEMIEFMKRDEHPKVHAEYKYRECIKNFQLVPRLTVFRPEATVNRYLNGTLDVYLHQLKRFETERNCYLTIQVDCFGGFFMKVYTSKVILNKKEPVFNQQFHVLLDSSHLLKISLYAHSESSNKYHLQGSAIFDMQSASLHSGYRLVTLQLYPVQSFVVAMSLRYAQHEVGYRRKYSVIPSNSLEKVKNMRGKVFEENINVVVKRECRKIPIIVTSCVEEIELRGLNEINLYSSEGNSQQVKDLMASFDLCSLTGRRYLKDKKYSAITIGCLLKKYLETLPAHLVTNPSSFLAAYDCPDKQIKRNKILSLVRRLPDTENSVLCYLIDHMINVSKNQSKNQMSIEALAKAFGPCLHLKEKATAAAEHENEIDKFSLVIEYIINMKMNGLDLSKQE